MKRTNNYKTMGRKPASILYWKLKRTIDTKKYEPKVFEEVLETIDSYYNLSDRYKV